MALLLFLIAVLLHSGCESRQDPPEPSQSVEPSISDLAPAPVESPATLPPPDTEAVPASDPVEEPTLGSPIAQEAPDGTSIHIVDSNGNGTVMATLPIFQSGDMRYFAAGVGRLERDATYPRFPVNLVFSGPDGAYLSFIAATVWAQDGTQVWQIPASHVKGPWVFLDLKDGKYRIDAVKDTDIKSRARIEVTTGQQQTIFFTWP